MRETIQNANGKQFHAVSLSGGKDSTAMLLLMMERDMPINMVLSADTGMEFPEMYEHLAKLDEHLFRERGIHITTLRHPKGFEYLMFDEPKQKPRSLETVQSWASRPTATAGRESASAGVPGSSKRTSSPRRSTGSKASWARSTMSVSPPMKRGAARMSGIPSWNGASRRRRRSKPVTTVALTSAGCMRFTTVRPAGAARSSVSTSCGSCESITRSCGKSCWSWIAVRWRSSAPARWDSSSRTGA